MYIQTEQLSHARTLRADILASPDIWLPRREIVLEWLDGFLQRAAMPRYALGLTEAEDLTALDHFLRTNKVPVTP